MYCNIRICYVFNLQKVLQKVLSKTGFTQGTLLSALTKRIEMHAECLHSINFSMGDKHADIDQWAEIKSYFILSDLTDKQFVELKYSSFHRQKHFSIIFSHFNV